jgi:hypothetical protein
MNMAVTSSAPCFNVLIILGNPYRCCASRRCNSRRSAKEILRSEFYKSDRSIFEAASFSVSGSTASGLLLSMNGKHFPYRIFPNQNQIGAGE